MDKKLIRTICIWLVIVICLELGIVALIGKPILMSILPATVFRIVAIAAGVAAAYLGYLELTAKKGKK